MSDPPTKQLLKADWVYPGASPLQRDAAVVIVNHNILSVGPAKTLQHDHPDASIIDLGSSIILPGLINAHAHLELSLLQPPAPMPLADWLLDLLKTLAITRSDNLTIRNAMLAGIAQCKRFGVTTVGDITADPASTRPVFAATSSLRAISYGEVRGMGARRNLLAPRIDAAAMPVACAFAVAASAHVRPGISPHAPYSTEPAGYTESLARAKQDHLPFTTHLAESADEATFLRDHAGPFRRLWDSLGGWEDNIPRWPDGPIRFAASLGLLDYPTSLAHVNYCDDAELAILARGRASVVYCPRTHRYFNHPPHRWRDMLAAGINVAVGTDSCASSPNLNLVDDLRLLHEIAPDYPVDELWKLATINAARALQWDHQIGMLAPNFFADLTVFDAKSSDPLREILENGDRIPREVWIGGKGHPASVEP